MYDELASWFHLVTAPADYADEAADVVRLLASHGVDVGPANPDATVLELGSGGGNTASHLKARARLTLTDVAPAMLVLSATLNPECGHVEGIFPRAAWLRILADVRLRADVSVDAWERDVFVGVRP